MKTTLILIIYSFLAIYAYPQDTLRTQDLTNAGENYLLSIGSAFTGIDPVGTGANYSWDFSQLGRTAQRIDTVFSISSTNIAFVVFFSFLHPSDQAIKGASMQAAGIGGLSDVYNFYNNTNGSFTQTGFGTTVNGVPLPIAYSVPDVLYKFPLKYNDQDSTSYEYSIDLSSTVGIYFGAKKSRHNIVDGWGTLITPYGTFDALRVQSTIIERDSVHIDSLGFGLNLPAITTKEFKWMGKATGLPLLEINTSASNVISQILYQDSAHFAGISAPDLFAVSPVIYPNPVKANFSVRYSLREKTNIAFDLLTQEGKTIFSKTEEAIPVGEKVNTFDLSAYQLVTGNYFLKMKAGNSVLMRPIFIQRD